MLSFPLFRNRGNQGAEKAFFRLFLPCGFEGQKDSGRNEEGNSVYTNSEKRINRQGKYKA